MKNKQKELKICDRIILNGYLCGNDDGSGNIIKKSNTIMYVVSLSPRDNCKYPLGLSYSLYGMRIGWTSYQDIIKIPSTIKRPNRSIDTKCIPNKLSHSLNKDYIVSNKLGTKIKYNAYSNSKSLIKLPYGHVVNCDGHYSVHNGRKWLFIETCYKNINYTGFCAIDHLKQL